MTLYLEISWWRGNLDTDTEKGTKKDWASVAMSGNGTIQIALNKMDISGDRMILVLRGIMTQISKNLLLPRGQYRWVTTEWSDSCWKWRIHLEIFGCRSNLAYNKYNRTSSLEWCGYESWWNDSNGGHKWKSVWTSTDSGNTWHEITSLNYGLGFRINQLRWTNTNGS